LSTSDATVALAPLAVLNTTAAEIAGDSTTDVSGILRTNASLPEAFLPLFDVVGGALLIRKYLGQQATQELGREAKP
jgi:hypothetical protein